MDWANITAGDELKASEGDSEIPSQEDRKCAYELEGG